MKSKKTFLGARLTDRHDTKAWRELVLKSIAAALFIALGVAILLNIGAPLGAFLFALGLLLVCTLGANLFTGKCGYLILGGISWLDLCVILAVNLVAGWLFGACLGIGNPALVETASAKIASWQGDLAFFAQAMFCGVVMFVAVDVFKRRDSLLGVLFGVPLFILCGFQHCIANIITLGVATTFSPTIFLAILGNFLGAVFVAALLREPADSKILGKRVGSNKKR